MLQARSAPRPLSRSAIVRAAIALADREGIEAVSMRRVAAALGAGTMSLYRHVASREAMLDAVVDDLYSGMELPAEPSPEWRRDAVFLAHTHRRLLWSHPWVTALVGGRPPVLPSFLRVLEFSLATYERAGLTIAEAAQSSAAMSALVIGFAVFDEAERTAKARSGLTKEQWQLVHAPEVVAEVTEDRYPALVRFVEAGEVDPTASFAAAVDHLLDGIERSAARGGQRRVDQRD